MRLFVPRHWQSQWHTGKAFFLKHYTPSRTYHLVLGFVDVTAVPFHAGPTGRNDATKALQDAIVFAREHQLV